MSDYRLNFRFVDNNGETGRVILPWEGATHGDQLTDSFAHHDAVRAAYLRWVEAETGLSPDPTTVDPTIKMLPDDEAFLTILVEDTGDGCGTYAMTGHAQIENAASGVGEEYVRRYPMKREG